jgi:hypothetical protein
MLIALVESRVRREEELKRLGKESAKKTAERNCLTCSKPPNSCHPCHGDPARPNWDAIDPRADTVSDLCNEVRTLREELERAKADLEDENMRHKNTRKQLSSANRVASDAIDDVQHLRKYARHHDGCPAAQYPVLADVPCTCGFDEGWKEKTRADIAAKIDERKAEALRKANGEPSLHDVFISMAYAPDAEKETVLVNTFARVISMIRSIAVPLREELGLSALADVVKKCDALLGRS